MSNTRTSHIDRCSTSQLKTLLGLAAEKTRAPGSSLGAIRGGRDLERLLTELCEDTNESGEALLSAVTERDTSLPALVGVKDLAKAMLAGARTEQHQAAATLLYHGAIAAAFARHGANISSVPPESRLGLYEDLASAVTADSVAVIFREAADRLAAEAEPAP